MGLVTDIYNNTSALIEYTLPEYTRVKYENREDYEKNSWDIKEKKYGISFGDASDAPTVNKHQGLNESIDIRLSYKFINQDRSDNGSKAAREAREDAYTLLGVARSQKLDTPAISLVTLEGISEPEYIEDGSVVIITLSVNALLRYAV